MGKLSAVVKHLNRMCVPLMTMMMFVVLMNQIVLNNRISETAGALQRILVTNQTGIPVHIQNRSIDVDVQNNTLDVEVKNALDVEINNSSPINVNVDNSELDVNVTNSELDVKLNSHFIRTRDPIPVRIEQ